MKTCSLCHQEKEERDILLIATNIDTNEIVHICYGCFHRIYTININAQYPDGSQIEIQNIGNWAISKEFSNEGR